MSALVKMVQISRSFGKGDGEEVILTKKFSTIEELQQILEDEGFEDDLAESEVQELFEKHQAIYISNDGGDWDDPTGFSVEVFTKEEKLKALEREYKAEVEKVEKLFAE